ncbi:MAG: hypothetical protein M3R35_01740 [Candidatus Eremiobacteraeota bacterium]|nr:hypothetical protein [Candidatus Eremiobacteraeota bacterium]
MTAFANFSDAQVAGAAEKFIAKMNENDLAVEIGRTERDMDSSSRSALIEAVFDAFRERGESSEDAAEGAGTAVTAIESGDAAAVEALLKYAQQNSGLLREAAITFIESHPKLAAQLSPVLVDGIAKKLMVP